MSLKQPSRRRTRVARLAALSLSVAACGPELAPDGSELATLADELRVSVTASVETTPVPHSGDAADDSAVWVHPTDPALSRIIGTDKLGGIAVYDLSGRQV